MSILNINHANQTVKMAQMAKISRLGSKFDLTRLKSTWKKIDLTRLTLNTSFKMQQLFEKNGYHAFIHDFWKMKVF